MCAYTHVCFQAIEARHAQGDKVAQQPTMPMSAQNDMANVFFTVSRALGIAVRSIKHRALTIWRVDESLASSPVLG